MLKMGKGLVILRKTLIFAVGKPERRRLKSFMNRKRMRKPTTLMIAHLGNRLLKKGGIKYGLSLLTEEDSNP